MQGGNRDKEKTKDTMRGRRLKRRTQKVEREWTIWWFGREGKWGDLQDQTAAEANR